MKCSLTPLAITTVTLLLCQAIQAIVSAPVDSEAQNDRSTDRLTPWEYITYPPVVLDGNTNLNFLVGYGQKMDGMRVDILFFGGDERPDIFRNERLSLRLHETKGRILSPKTELGPVQTGGQWSLISVFPSATNAFEEAWVEIGLGGQRYWLEVPYGLARNPLEPLPPPVAEDRPKVVPAIRTNDCILHWRTVQYDLGVIQNSWRLSLVQSNPFDAQTEVILYREDTQIGKSMYLWDLHTPRTKVRVIDRSGAVVQSLCMSLRLHEDGMRRSDTFHLSRNGDSERSWGAIEVRVDEKTYRAIVPSSLYKYTHGHAETLPAQRTSW